MAEVVLTKTVNVSIEDAWAVWDDFHNVAKFNPLLASSHATTGKESLEGLGAQRQCNMADGKNWIKEEIVAYTPLKEIKIAILESTMPLKEGMATIKLKKLGEHKTQVLFTMTFTPKMGLIGKLMTPMMKKQFSTMLGQMLDSYAKYSEEQPSVAVA